MPLPEDRQSKARRQKIMQNALTLFILKGYFTTSLRDIITVAGVGAGTFYNYFVDKEDVLKALLEGFAQDIIQHITSYYSVEKDLLERFVETKRITMEVFADNEALSELYSRVAGSSQIIDDCLKTFEDTLLAFYARNIEYGIRKGVFADVSVPPVACAILAAEKYFLYKWIVQKDITKEEMIEMVVSFHRTLARGLLRGQTP